MTRSPISECHVCQHQELEHGFDCPTCRAWGVRGACEQPGCSCSWYQSLADELEREDWQQEQWQGFRDGLLTRTGRPRKHPGARR